MAREEEGHQPSAIGHDPDLLRGLGRADVVFLTVNNTIGAGIFTMPAVLVAGAGSWSPAILLLTLGLISLMALCMIEVASRYDVTGGPMVYAGIAFGPAAGFVVGWLMYLSRLAAFGAIAAIMLDYSTELWPALESQTIRTLVTSVFVATLALINLRGVGRGALASNVLTTLKIVPLVALAVVGAWFGQPTSQSLSAPGSLDSLGGAVLVALFACMGFETAVVVSREVRNPNRDLPIGILAGIAGVGVLYTLLIFVCITTVPDLAHARRPLADAAAGLLGGVGATLVSLTAVLSCAGTLSVWMIASPRVFYALGQHGDFPRVLARVDPIHRTPGVAIMVSALLVWVLTVSGTFVYLATFSAIARMLTYASTCAALIVLRKREGPAPVSIPLGPIVSVLSVVICFLALATTTGTAIRDVSIAVALGCVLRAAVRRVHRLNGPVPVGFAGPPAPMPAPSAAEAHATSASALPKTP